MTSVTSHAPYFRPGFTWSSADAYLFDIDGTLLNCSDAVHFHAFHRAFREVMGVEASLDGLLLHGNTDTGILRAALQREGISDAAISARMQPIVDRMCDDVARNQAQMKPHICPSIPELLASLAAKGKLVGTASGNLETIAWIKLKRAGLREAFSFGSFAWPLEARTEIFRHAVSQAKTRAGETADVCVIGDTPADVQAARAAGIKVITLATGIYGFSELRGTEPDGCCASAADLLAHLHEG